MFELFYGTHYEQTAHHFSDEELEQRLQHRRIAASPGEEALLEVIDDLLLQRDELRKANEDLIAPELTTFRLPEDVEDVYYRWLGAQYTARRAVKEQWNVTFKAGSEHRAMQNWLEAAQNWKRIIEIELTKKEDDLSLEVAWFQTAYHQVIEDLAWAEVIVRVLKLASWSS